MYFSSFFSSLVSLHSFIPFLHSPLFASLDSFQLSHTLVLYYSFCQHPFSSRQPSLLYPFTPPLTNTPQPSSLTLTLKLDSPHSYTLLDLLIRPTNIPKNKLHTSTPHSHPHTLSLSLSHTLHFTHTLRHKMTKIKPRLIARISCQECRRRKTRCNFDGQNQKCSTCARIGTACIFSQKNGVILDMDKVMEENNPHLVHQREKEQRAKERARLAANTTANTITSSSSSSSAAAGLMGPILAPAPDMSVYSKSSPSSSYLSSSVYPNRLSRSNSTSGALPLKGPSSSTEDLSSVMDRLQIDAFGIAPHTLRSFSQVAGDNDSAETSSSEYSDNESTHPNNALSDSQDPKDVLSSPLMNKRNSAGSTSGSHHRSSRSRSVPLVDIQPDLIDLYFQHVHPYLLIIHKPSFFRRLHDPRDPVPDFVLAAMYAAASHYAPGREQDGRRYFEFWQSRLDDTLDKPRLSTIQALLMIIKYQEGVKKTGFYFRTYMYTQMVIVLARVSLLFCSKPMQSQLTNTN